MYTHVATCDICCGGLRLVMAEIDKSSFLPGGLGCERYLHDLPAFVEQQEQDDALAAQAFPHVVLHLAHCEDCAETYHLTRALREAEQQGMLTAPPHWLPPQQ